MNKFAELLDRLAYEPGRNNKLRLIADYLRTTPDPERGFALAALTGALSFQHAKAGMIRALIAERTDPVLFELSYDYVGDLSETVALMWPADPSQKPNATPSLSEVVETLSTLGKAQLPGQLARWLDALDETGRWALLKLVTGGLRIGVSARLAKTAAASLGGKEPDEIEMLWPGLAPPYAELFAWLEGRADKPVIARSGALPPGDAGARARGDGFRRARSDASSWRSGSGTASASRRWWARRGGQTSQRLYSRTGEDVSKSFPDLAEACACPARSTASCWSAAT